MTSGELLPDDAVLRVSGLGKTFRLYPQPGDRLKELLFRRPYHTDFTALDDVSFTLLRGRALGVVGDNGAGKSTLLQLIAGTLNPSRGTAEMRGRALGLLELGVGFHEDFTGRQNVFVYGGVLGLSGSAVQARLDEIVGFSELGAFIDQPLKTYSSGMRMRLAFALVSTLDPEILIVDEALAVGDIHFQKKCIDRMKDIKSRGRTILFCSHSTYLVGMFCDEVLWLKKGRVEMLGSPNEVLPRYEAYQLGKDGGAGHTERSAFAGTPVRIAGLDLLGPSPMRSGTDLRVRIRTESESDSLPFHVTLSIKMDNGRGVYVTGTHLSGRPPLRGRQREIVVTYPRVPLMGGLYSAHARLFDDHGLMLYHEKALPEIWVQKDSRELGICYLENEWEIS